MKNLYLLRHAHTEGYSLSIPDYQRKLTDIGIKDVSSLGHILKTEKVNIDLIISSSAIRARKTASILAQQLDYDATAILQEKSLYQCTEDILLKYINELQNQDAQDVLLVNHNPTISSFVRVLTGIDYGFMSPCSLAKISFPTLHWGDVSKGLGKLAYFRHAQQGFITMI